MNPKSTLKSMMCALSSVVLSSLIAAEPLSWERTPNRPAPAQFDVFHGESLDFRCTFTGFGALPFAGASDVRLWYQTNGMGAAWWSIPATVSSNALAATFTPDRDPGAERLSVFFGAPSNAYAAAQVRFRNSPGATPNVLPPPDTINWLSQLTSAINALASSVYTKEETDAKIVELAPAPDMSGVVHGDDRQADKTNFANGLRFRASDSDGGNMRFLVQDPMDSGLTWYSDSSGTTFGNPFLRINSTGIRYPKDVEADEFGLLEWSDFTRTHTILDTMPAYSSSRQDYQFPISAGAFLDYFWNIQDLPSAAAAKFARTVPVKAASNLVDRAGALVDAEGIEERAAQLTATSTVPVYAFSDWSSDWPSDDEVQPTQPVWTNGAWYVWVDDPYMRDGPFIVQGSEGDTNLNYTLYGYPTAFWRTRSKTGDLNAYGLARRSDITNTVTKAYVEGLGIEAGISEENAIAIAESAAEAATEGMITVEQDPNWAAEKDEYAKTGTVAQVSEAVGTLWSYIYGDSVWIAVTNYMRTVGGVSPSFQLWEVRGGATNLVYWSKEEITNVTHDLIHDCKTNLEATVRNAVAEMPDKAWSKYQSATGNEAPEGVTIVSTPTIQLTGGGEWYRYIDVARNSVWFLKSNGLHTFGGDTNGYFRILDDEGNTTFEVRKTDSYLVDAVASSVHFDEDGNFCVSFLSNIQPVIYTTASLSNPNFLPEGDDPNVTVTWAQSGGTYTATLEQTVKGPSLFAYAKVEVQGETVIRNTVPTDMQGGIMLNGVKYSVGTATISGNTVLTLTPRN